MDMEWNQALTFSEMVKDPVFLTGEIIQIGAIKLNQTLEVVDSFNEQIAPQYYTELHPKVAEITKLSNRDLQKGKGFHTVFNSFCDWCGDDFVFLVWGTEDLRILRKNMDLHNIDTSFMPPCFNLQNIFVAQVTHDTKQYALANALAIVGEVPFDSHDALNDARSTALLCTHLDLIRGLNEYKETVENRNGIVESYEFEEPYADIGDALSDDYVVSFECPHCGEIVWGENWIRKTGTNLLSLSQCSDGQEYLISLKFRPIAENKVVVKRLVYALTDELRTNYQQCMEQAAAWSKYVTPHTRFDCEEITMLKLFDTVTLKNDDPETGVKAGTEGTIVDVLGNGKAFTVEFFDEDGNTIEASLYTEYTPAQLQKVETALTLT